MPATKAHTNAVRRARLSVLLIDPHPIVRAGLRCILERQPDLRVGAETGDAHTALQEAERAAPHIAIMDMAVKGMNALDATRALTRKSPGIGVIILCANPSPSLARRALEAGARGFVAHDIDGDELVGAVRAAAAGDRYLSSAVRPGVEGRRKSGGPESPIDVLTGTEQKILKQVTEGRSNAEVAAAIGLSPRTVETYRVRLMRKLGIENLPSLVRYAIRQGVISLD